MLVRIANRGDPDQTASRIANREDPDQTASSGLGLHCLYRDLGRQFILFTILEHLL